MPLQNVIRLRFTFTNLACLSSAVSLPVLSSASLLSVHPLFSPFSLRSASLLSVLSLPISLHYLPLNTVVPCVTCIIIEAHLMQEVFVYLLFTLRACDGRNSHAHKNLKGLSILFYCSLSIHATVLAHSH